MMRLYGVSGDRPSTDDDPVEPLTAYARCKVLVEEAVGALADDTFSPVFLRNATVYGASPREGFELVVNDLAATAFLHQEIRMSSDGTPWRPFVHLLDVAAAVVCVLDAPGDLVHGQVFNVGSSTSNDQVRQIAEVIGGLVPGCALRFGDPRNDKRNYRIDFSKIDTTLPGFSCTWDIERGVAELLDVFACIGLDEPTYPWRGYTRLVQIRHPFETAQIDDEFFWTVTR